MTDPVRTATSPNNLRAGLHGDAPARRMQWAPASDDNLLPLTGGMPQTVNLSLVAGIPVFSLPGSTQLYSGIRWEACGYALMITFAFQQPPPGSPASQFIRELAPITPAVWVSDTFPDTDPQNQMCCIPSVLGEYHFNVVMGDRSMLVDPKIVVTPIGGPGDGVPGK